MIDIIYNIFVNSYFNVFRLYEKNVEPLQQIYFDTKTMSLHSYQTVKETPCPLNNNSYCDVLKAQKNTKTMNSSTALLKLD